MKGLGKDSLWQEYALAISLTFGKRRFNYWFDVLREKLQGSFQALLQNNSIKYFPCIGGR